MSLVEKLQSIAQYYTLNKDVYRAKAYIDAVKVLLNNPQQVNGFGKSVQADIDEYYSTGKISRLDNLVACNPNKEILQEFADNYGVGPATAQKWYDLGYRSLAQVAASGIMTAAQYAGYIYAQQINTPILRQEMDYINYQLRNQLSTYSIYGELAGSYRRGKESSNDIDLLVWQYNFTMQDVINILSPFIVITLASGENKWMGIIRMYENSNAHRLDIRLVSAQQWPYALLYFTGSAQFNILLRQQAKNLNLTLNEYGLYDNFGNSYPANSEADIFHHLQIPYYTPEQRNI